jgi:hypothetical protein
MHNACSSETPSGIGIMIEGCVTAFCAYPPPSTGAKTRTPFDVVPTTSIPGISGSFWAERYEFSVWCVSA